MYQYGTNLHNYSIQIVGQFVFHMNYIIGGWGALVDETGKEQPLKAGDFALINPEGLTQGNRARRASS